METNEDRTLYLETVPSIGTRKISRTKPCTYCVSYCFDSVSRVFSCSILHTILSKLLPVAQSEDGSHSYLPSEHSQVRSSNSSISHDRLSKGKRGWEDGRLDEHKIILYPVLDPK